MTHTLCLKNTLIGVVGVEVKKDYVVRVLLPGTSKCEVTKKNDLEIIEGSLFEDLALIRDAFRQLDEYFQGTRRSFELPLAPEGTAFMQKVWSELMNIPYGQTTTYSEIARQLGKLGAARAVGQANNRNPIPIIIPCHRVVGVKGKLVGYAAGLELKTKLLELEKTTLLQNAIYFL